MRSINRPGRRTTAAASGVWLAAAAALTLTPAPGFFATVVDSVVSRGNSVETTGMDPSPPDSRAVNIQAALPVLVGDQPMCSGPDLAWSDDAVPAIFDSSVGVAPSPPRRVYDAGFVCVRHADPVSPAVDVSLVVANFVETDPTCATGEADVDANCGTTDPGSGEISGEFYWGTSVTFSSRGEVRCARENETRGEALRDGSRIAVARFTGSDGAICIGFRLSTQIPDDSRRLTRVLTDRAEWDWVVEGVPA